jgi:hypothetical protein
LDDPNLGLSVEAINRLRNPIRRQPDHPLDNSLRTAIKLYLGNPSEETYKKNRDILVEHCPNAKIPSYYRTGRIVAELTGIESVVHHMCINSCVAFTGPFLDLNNCPVCSEPHYDQFQLQSTAGKKKFPRQEFHTIPIGPQLQALYQEPVLWTYLDLQGKPHLLVPELMLPPSDPHLFPSPNTPAFTGHSARGLDACGMPRPTIVLMCGTFALTFCGTYCGLILICLLIQ